MQFTAEADILILHAGETGNAEEVAYDIRKNVGRPSRTMSIGDYDVLNLPTEKFVVFVVSTTGDGDPPKPMKGFWSFLLRKGLPCDALADLHFAVFGLGDSSYDKYNAVGRKLQKRLGMLGAHEMLDMGLGDDQAPYGYLSAYNNWLNSLLQHVASTFPKSNAVFNTDDTEYSVINLANYKSMDINHLSQEISTCTATVVENRRLTADVWAQNVRHIALNIKNTAEKNGTTNNTAGLYSLGDVAVVHYRNPDELVRRAAAIIIEGCRLHCGVEYSPDTTLAITCHTPQSVGRRPSRLSPLRQCSLYTLLERYLDIGAVPKRSYFALLSMYATNPEEADKLRELSSAEGTDLYYDYCIQERKSYVEVLEEFRSCRPPLSELLKAVQVIPPRRYSIASSPSVNPFKIELCVAVATRRTPYGRKRTGLCSGYLSRLVAGDMIDISFERGAIHETPITSPAPTPLILVGPGTGVAPMRALIQQRCAAQLYLPTQQQPLPHALLFFGCRKKQRDYLYTEEWAALNAGVNPYYPNTSSVLPQNGVQVISAFSQDQDIKDYVTHRIKDQGKIVCAMLQQGGVIFVAGASKRMPADVRKALSAVLVEHADMTQSDSEEFLTRLERSKKYITEAWS